MDSGIAQMAGRCQNNASQGSSRTFEVGLDPAPRFKRCSFGSEFGAGCKSCLIFIIWRAGVQLDSTIVLRNIHSVKGRFDILIAIGLAMMPEGTRVEEWSQDKWANNLTDMLTWGEKSTAVGNTDQRPRNSQTFREAVTVSDLSNRPVTVMEAKGSVMFCTCLCIFNLRSSWTRLLRALVWLARFRGQLLVMKGVQLSVSARIRAPNSEDMCFSERDIIRMQQLGSVETELAGNNYRRLEA